MWMTPCLYIFLPGIRDANMAYARRAAPGAKSAVYVCRVVVAGEERRTEGRCRGDDDAAGHDVTTTTTTTTTSDHRSNAVTWSRASRRIGKAMNNE